ncbi:hypothetical protein [Flavimarina sp. Hel_I_48]|uniref:hypothetical protein n=1 Tax=Flavimarina sp. Hel_I_48 TaxID=1392488 RepID=UPI0004DF58D2|nr:hypothetical protein [Flavimarina sp. Hel_I_48]
MRIVLYILFSLGFLSAEAQIGINTTEPRAMLHVEGNGLLEGNLYLEEPGDFNEIRGSKLLVNSTTNTVLQYDIEQSKYGPINYAQFAFENTNTNGLLDYDTKISTTDYLVTVQGYYFAGPNNNTNIMSHSNSNVDEIPGFQVYAYKNTTTETWFLRGFFNDGTFRSPNSSGVYVDVQVDIYMNLIIFRNGFISKPQNDVIVDMGNSETFTAPLPAGF